MPANVYSRLWDLTVRLQRLVRGAPLPLRVELDAVARQLDALITATVGPPAQPASAPCPVCREAACTHWQFLNAEETR